MAKSKKMKDLMKICEEISENKQFFAKKLINRIVFMEDSAERLEKVIKNKGSTVRGGAEKIV